MPRTDDIFAALERLEKEVLPEIRAEIREARAWTRWRVLALIGGVAVLVVLIVLVGLLALSNRHTGETAKQAAASAARSAACVQAYANADAARSNLLAQPSIDQQVALANGFRSLLPFGAPKTAAQQSNTEQKFLIYLQKADAFQSLAQTNLPPPGPKVICP